MTWAGRSTPRAFSTSCAPPPAATAFRSTSPRTASPDATGDKRGKYIRSHVHAIERALGEGIPVRGYFHWSLVDNFEWADGFAPRFGLYRVDAATLNRAAAGGAETFAALAPK